MNIRASHHAAEDFSSAFEEYKDEIFRHCYFHAYQREVATDITQETFIHTWEYIAKGNDIDNVRAFLYRTATNLCINYHRKKKSTSLEALQEAGFDPGKDDDAHHRDFVEEQRAMGVLHTIDEPYRSALSMRYINDLSPKEIAEVTGETANTVSAHVTRGLKMLRSNLKNV